jgi:thiamine kinase-like enzyme
MMGVSLDLGTVEDDRLGVWQVLKKWTKTVDGILKAIDSLDSLDMVCTKQDQSRIDVNPLTTPARLLAWRSALDFPTFLKTIARFRVWVDAQEKRIGRSERVFGHNDLLGGNILLKLPGSERPDATSKDTMLV